MRRHVTTLLRRFVPEGAGHDPVALRRTQLIVGILLAVAAVLPFQAIAEAMVGAYRLAVASIVTEVVVLLVLGIFAQRKDRPYLYQVPLVWGYLVVVVLALDSGGIRSPVLPFLVIKPLMSMSLGHTRAARVWAGIAVATALALGFLESVGIVEGTVPPVLATTGAVTLNLVVLVGYVFGFAAFQSSLNAIHREMLVEQKTAADDANAAKSEFLANMSHELRTPMNGVLGLTEITLMDPTLAPRHRQRLQTVLESGRALVELLNDILDVSKVEAGQLVLEDIPWRPAHVLTDVHRLFGEVARRKGLEFSLSVDDTMQTIWVQGDPGRVRQVVYNLVGNAVKFSSTGRVELRLFLRAEALVIAVQDSGPGIAPDQQARIFQPFVQADASTARVHGGSGLGLTICRRLTALMGGDIELESTLGHGSTFRIVLPLRMCAAPHQPADVQLVDEQPFPAPATAVSVLPGGVSAGAFAGCRVLLVEDVEVNQMVATTMLAQLGIDVDLAADGGEGLSKILSGAPYDLVLMDWQLPELNGLEVTRLVRLAGHRLPILGLTASVRPSDRENALAVGMDGVVHKPFTRDELVAALSSVLHRAPSSAGAGRGEPPPSLH